MRDLDDIASRDASMPPSPRTGGSREDLRKQLKVCSFSELLRMNVCVMNGQFLHVNGFVCPESFVDGS